MTAPLDAGGSDAERLAGVLATLRLYFDGLHHSDTARLRRAFHPQAIYACASETPALVLRLPDYFPIVDARPAPAARGLPLNERIIGIEFAGPVTALARVECEILPKRYIDLLTLIRVEDRWQIIAKVFHYRPGEPATPHHSTP